jgi:hypothetical protein
MKDQFNEMISSLSNLTGSYWWEKNTLEPSINSLLNHDLVACTDGCGQYGVPDEMYYDDYTNELYISKEHYLKDREIVERLEND